jgi:hypothetical protein
LYRIEGPFYRWTENVLNKEWGMSDARKGINGGQKVFDYFLVFLAVFAGPPALPWAGGLMRMLSVLP